MELRGFLGLLAACSCTLACSGSLTESDDYEGPLTVCAYATGLADDLIGKGCEADEECANGKCLKPGDPGNITNEVFGFCTRACNCNDDPNISIESSDATRSCVYPGGCFSGTGADRYRHAVRKCLSLSDCQAVDGRYTHCTQTDSKTVIDDKTCGHLHKVCQAHL